MISHNCKQGYNHKHSNIKLVNIIIIYNGQPPNDCVTRADGEIRYLMYQKRQLCDKLFHVRGVCQPNEDTQSFTFTDTDAFKFI